MLVPMLVMAALCVFFGTMTMLPTSVALKAAIFLLGGGA
jgi:hypothetical protein